MKRLNNNKPAVHYSFVCTAVSIYPFIRFILRSFEFLNVNAPALCLEWQLYCRSCAIAESVLQAPDCDRDFTPCSNMYMQCISAGGVESSTQSSLNLPLKEHLCFGIDLLYIIESSRFKIKLMKRMLLSHFLIYISLSQMVMLSLGFMIREML